MCTLEFMKSSSKHFDKEGGKDTEMVVQSGEVFLKEVRSALRTKG